MESNRLFQHSVELRENHSSEANFSPLRVLHCIPSLGGGGAERQLSHIVGELCRTGVEIHVAYVFGGPNLDVMRDSGAILHRLPARHNYDPFVFLQLVRTIYKVKPDIIQTWLTQMDILGGLGAILTGTPFILSEQASSPAYTENWKNKLRTWIGLRASMIVANSQTGRQYWIPRKEPRRIKVVPNGLPLEQIRQSPLALDEDIGIDSSKELILFAGRYDHQKNVLTLVEALQLVLSEREDVIVFMYGQGPLEKELVDTVKHRGLDDRIRIGGYTTQLWSLMRRANVFVSVSFFEGSPNVVLEAAALRCPLVLSAIPEHRELLDDGSAFFACPTSSIEIARAINQALSDPCLAESKASSAYKAVCNYSLESVIPAYLGLYRLALARQCSSRS